jgi:hypothetical protein
LGNFSTIEYIFATKTRPFIDAFYDREPSWYSNKEIRRNPKEILKSRADHSPIYGALKTIYGKRSFQRAYVKIGSLKSELWTMNDGDKVKNIGSGAPSSNDPKFEQRLQGAPWSRSNNGKKKGKNNNNANKKKI